MTYDTILFDLDGTLTDPKIGITKSVAYSLKHMRDMDVELDDLVKFIGPPLKDSYMEYYDFTEDEAAMAIESFREYFKETGIYENEVYEGIKDLLIELMSLGKKIFVATSKPTVFAEVVLKHFELQEYFISIIGSNLDGSRTKKAEVIQEVLNIGGIEDKSKVIMVGDREHDILGAKETGIDSLGVEYGYGSREELIEAGADYIVSGVQGLRTLLIG